MGKKIAIAVLVLVALFIVVVSTRSPEFTVKRSMAMAVPPAIPFGMVNDFRRWASWSPWEKLDPSMKKEFSGSPSGSGAVYAWAGNDDVGEGRMTILQSVPPERISLKLEFLKPWQATHSTEFTFRPSGAGTEVTWTMSGHNDFMGKAFSLFMDIDKMVGKDFQQGLANLKAAAEAEHKPGGAASGKPAEAVAPGR